MMRIGIGTTPDRSAHVGAIAAATSAAVEELFRDYPDDHFYYCSLITTGEGLAPNISAWSSEALDAAVRRCNDDPNARSDLKWSYADSPFYCHGERHFDEVRRMFDALGVLDPMDELAWWAAYDFRISAMEEALATVDRGGLFGTGPQRESIVINVEVMPPDHTNVERAIRLNPPEALTKWLQEAAEPERSS